MSLSVNQAQLANRSTASYLSRSFNIEPPERRMMPGCPRYQTHSERLRSSGGMDCDEVFPGIIIGDCRAAKDLKYLQKLDVTHVLNMAENDVHLNPQKLSKVGIAYKGFHVRDLAQEDVSQYFEAIAEFIDRSTGFGSGGGGLVFVTSHFGMSRAATAVAAYLMLKKRMSASEAITLMRKSREVRPNMGFLHQLGILDDRLRKERYRW